MSENQNHNSKDPSGRRHFIGTTIKLAALGTILGPLEQACNNNKGDKTGGLQKEKKPVVQKPGTRSKWNYEKLVMNTKTKVVHLPTAAVYVFYDEIANKHLQEINLSSWENAIRGDVHINKGQSGNILEILSLKKLGSGVNDDSLNAAMNTLSYAFDRANDNTKGFNRNTKNYRLHELMLQLIALNNSIPEIGKWQVFNEKVKKPAKIGRRQQWMASENNFNERIRYITTRESEYKERLTKRAMKYTIT
jgi:hypothetical protein